MSSTTPHVSDSTATRQQQQRVSAAQAGLRLGERLRQLRVAAGLTQTELAGDRFSKEYVSQIERGKTRPTPETIQWLANRLGVDPGFLANGVSADQRGRVEAALPRAIGLLERARALSEGSTVSELERADVLFRLGVARYKLNSTQTALGLFDEALKAAERSEIPSDQLRSNIFAWRSRCYQRRRDFEAAREDVERALELAESLNDRRTAADIYFQASIIAEREGHWLLARSYAERAKAAYEEIAERTNLGRLMNNLGGINFLLGHPDEALALLKNAVRIPPHVGNDVDAAYAVNGIAQVHLRAGDVALAEEQARYALELLDDRVDQLSEVGNAQLVLGRALLEQDRLDEAEE